jgi:hypothetical protein
LVFGSNQFPSGQLQRRSDRKITAPRVVTAWLGSSSNHSSTTVANRFVFIPPVSRVVEFWLAFGCNQNATFLLHLHLHINPLYSPKTRVTNPQPALAAWSQKRESDLFGSVTFDFGLA